MFRFPRVLLVSGVLATAGLATNAVVAQSSFQGLGDLPGGAFRSAAADVSADGVVVVGNADTGNGYEAFRWTQAGGMVGLGDLPGGLILSAANGVSADGAVVVGYSHYYDLDCDPNWPCDNLFEAFRWTQAGGMVGLGHPPGGSLLSGATGVSADGFVVVGGRGSYTLNESFVWDEVHGEVGLSGDISIGSMATDVSPDGAVVIGNGTYPGSGGLDREAFRWTAATGMIALGDLPGGFVDSYAVDLSADGGVVVGIGNYHVDCDPNMPCVYFYQGFRWTQAGGMVSLGFLPGGHVNSYAYGVSADGATVVGSSDSGSEPYEAYIWDAAHGMRSLRNVLIAAGLNLTGWRLTSAAGISADGRTIVGTGVNPSGQFEGWIARLGAPPCAGDLDGDGAVSLSDLSILLSHFGTPGGAMYGDGDLDLDGDVDLSDLALLLANFGTICP